MKTPSRLLVVLLIICTLRAIGDETPPLSEQETHQVRQQLKAYEQGALPFEEISGIANATNVNVLTNLTLFYKAHSNEVTLKMLLPISRCFVVTGNGAEGARLARSYLNVNSNDCRAWDILGAAFLSTESYDAALEAGTNALKFGCEGNLVSTGVLAMNAGRNDVVESMLIPRLLILKRTETDTVKKQDRLRFMVWYSIQVTNRDLYIKALEGVTAHDLGHDMDLRKYVKYGCKTFQAKETEKLCRELTR